mmetsp:Transcript_57017/g.114351  ORF Transcript_57017/g.114351 Transcript_57017/m.114351 type:complete len:874 (+) Transcript_57017:119-2740(+)
MPENHPRSFLSATASPLIPNGSFLDAPLAVGDIVRWAKHDDDIPLGTEGEIRALSHDGRADVQFPSNTFDLKVASLIRVGPSSSSFNINDIDDGSQWDFCFVAPLEGGKPSFAEMFRKSEEMPHEAQRSDQEVMAMCGDFQALGLETKQYLSVQGDEVYLLVRASEELLATLCEKSGTHMECRAEQVRLYGLEMQTRFPGLQVKSFEVPDQATMMERHGVDTSDLFPPYEHIFLPFKHNPVYKDLYLANRRFGKRAPTTSRHRPNRYTGSVVSAISSLSASSHATAPQAHTQASSGTQHGLPVGAKSSFFSTTLRIKLLSALIESSSKDGGAGVDLQLLTGRGWAVFPLHSRQERELLNNVWLEDRLIWFGWWQPTQEIRQYLGERVTMYFAFLGFHCRWLLGLGLVGVGVECAVLVLDDAEAKVVGFFSVVVAVWASMFCKFWKRRESYLACVWGMSDFEHNEQVRLAFKLQHPKKVPSAVTGEFEYRRPAPKAQAKKRLQSSLVMGLAVLLVLAVNVSLYLLKLWMRHSSVSVLSNNYNTLFSVALAVAISVCNVAFNALAEKLAEFENHRTDTGFRDSKIQKVFFVQVISSFGSLAYCAYLESYLEGGCGDGTRCMAQLSQLVVTILVERFLFTLLFDNVIPRAMAHYRFKKETSGCGKRAFSVAEEEFILDAYDQQNEIIRRYMDQVLMFGYMVLFVTALPAAPLLGYASNVIQVHEFGCAMLYRKQRNVPVGVQDIGAFQGCFETIAKLAIFTNAGLVFFTMRDVYFAGSSDVFVLWCLFGTLFLIVYLLSVVESVVGDVPECVRVQLERQSFLVEELFDHDELSEEVEEGGGGGGNGGGGGSGKSGAGAIAGDGDRGASSQWEPQRV